MTYQTIDTPHGLFDIPEDDSAIARSLVEYGEWAYFDIDFLLRFMSVGDVVVETPGCMGLYTVPFSRRIGPTGAVYTFEPAATCHLLKQNILRAQAHNVIVFRATLDAQTRPPVRPDDEGSGQPAEPALAEADAGAALHLDALGLADCHVMRLACQGQEWRALVGGMDLIGRTRPYISVLCADIQSAWTAASVLRWQGYQGWLYSLPVYNRDNFRHNKLNIFGSLRQCHLIFVPKEKREGHAIIDTAPHDFFAVESLQSLATAYTRSFQSGRLDRRAN
ncbi:MAG TPA: hypothetical protein VKT82_11935 [Ktedonobacterales bacterium]|nr:hypothetical protein [Ktedonobacterales bacterium]